MCFLFYYKFFNNLKTTRSFGMEVNPSNTDWRYLGKRTIIRSMHIEGSSLLNKKKFMLPYANLMVSIYY